MKKFINFAFLFLCFSVTLVSCKKYPEGPKINLKSPEARLVRAWKTESVKLNGRDVTSDYKLSQSEYREVYQSDGTVIVTFKLNNLTTTHNGTWEFVDKKNTLIVNINENLFPNKRAIRALTSKRFKYTSTIDGINYEIQLVAEN